MKKLFSLMILGLLVVSMLGVVSATTLVGGKIYDDEGIVVADADVTASCIHNSATNVETATSLSDGSYAVQYLEANCDTDDIVTVYAEKDEMSGTETGTVQDKGDYPGVDINLAIINVTVPEFGFFIGVLTLMGCVGVFFLVRKQ